MTKVRHCPKNKEYVRPYRPKLIEGTMGNLTATERDEVCKSIQEGFNSGYIIFGTYSLSYNVITTRRSVN